MAAAAAAASLVLVTGANRGIGLSLVQEYLKRGHKVLATARQLSKELQATGAECVDEIDVAVPADVEKLKAKVGDRKIGILINNAGIFLGDKLGEFDFEAMEKQFVVNSVAPLRVTEALLGNLEQGSKVAMITSRMGSVGDNGSGGYYGYRMSKAALNAASKSLAIELKPKGIAVGILHPGMVSTAMINFQGQISPEQSATWLAQRIDELSLENTGSFKHANGEDLPW